jgi:catechol 2,3-dioxygenase-like lactoylglutathione lyase family enzyme
MGGKEKRQLMAITGVHALLYTPEPDDLRATLRDVFGWEAIDSGGGWLIFKLPPAELGVHPSETTVHQLSVMCDDITATMHALQAQGIEFADEPTDRGFGVGATMRLPGGVELLLYEPRHVTAI